MKLIKQSTRPRPKVSLILLDWSVRESFHLLHYLGRQSVDRDDFEVIILEYYSRLSDALQPFAEQVDTWALLEVPDSCYYHKHLMYNAGIALSRGSICVICDSDAMVKEGYIGTIIGEFERDPEIVLHIDQFRNNRRDLYPFNYPSFGDVLGEGCINNVDGRTRGVLDTEDPIHSRNYGACMCARREDMIAIGGADEHIDFLGHICGPYDMTFRLVNMGRREVWHQSEFMYHTWHPGAAGEDNYLGPHDGRHVSTTALEALASKRTMPLLENHAIRLLRTAPETSRTDLLDKVIRTEDFEYWRRENVEKGFVHRRFSAISAHIRNYKGFSIHSGQGRYYAHLLIEPRSSEEKCCGHKMLFEGATVEDVCRKIDEATPFALELWISASRLYILAWQLASHARSAIANPGRMQRMVSWIRRQLTRLLPSGGQRGTRPASFAERQLADSLGDLIPNLHHFREIRPDIATAGPPMLLVDSVRFAAYLKLIAVLRVLPPLQIIRMATTAQLRAFLRDYAATNKKAPLILARGVYFRYYAIIGADKHARNAAII